MEPEKGLRFIGIGIFYRPKGSTITMNNEHHYPVWGFNYRFKNLEGEHFHSGKAIFVSADDPFKVTAILSVDEFRNSVEKPRKITAEILFEFKPTSPALNVIALSGNYFVFSRGSRTKLALTSKPVQLTEETNIMVKFSHVYRIAVVSYSQMEEILREAQ